MLHVERQARWRSAETGSVGLYNKDLELIPFMFVEDFFNTMDRLWDNFKSSISGI